MTDSNIFPLGSKWTATDTLSNHVNFISEGAFVWLTYSDQSHFSIYVTNNLRHGDQQLKITRNRFEPNFRRSLEQEVNRGHVFSKHFTKLYV